jgi:hypothetical protein
MRPKILPQQLKSAVEKAFADPRKLAELSSEERELAARFYEEVAHSASGSKALLARLYNLERARFLRGEVKRIAATAVQFAKETDTP